MKKAIKIVIFLIIISIFPLYYYMRFPFSSGIYPIREAGLIILPVDSDKVTNFGDFKLQIVWVKGSPFSTSVPKLSKVELYDQDGDLVSAINGDTKPVITDNVWYKREAAGYINLTLNAVEEVGVKSSVTNAIKNKKENIKLSKVIIKEGSKIDTFNLGNKEEVILMKKDKFNKYMLSSHNESASVKGGNSPYIKSSFDGDSNISIFEILYYLPGMDDSYLQSNTLIKGTSSKTFKKYSDNTALSDGNAELNIKISKGVLDELRQTVCIINPYYVIRNEKGEETFYGLNEGKLCDISNYKEDYTKHLDRYIVEPQIKK